MNLRQLKSLLVKQNATPYDKEAALEDALDEKQRKVRPKQQNLENANLKYKNHLLPQQNNKKLKET